MKVHIMVTADDGVCYEGDADLVAASTASSRRKTASKGDEPATSNARATAVDFDLPLRAFANRYAKNLSGRGKYAVLVARLVGGKIGASVSPREVERQWRSMTEPMGGAYNGAHLSRAKNEGWIDQPTRDSVVLLKDWVQALDGK